MSLLEETIAAHGGRARWAEIERIRLRLRCGGLAMPMKRRPEALRDLRAEVEVHRPRVHLAGLGTFDAAQGRPEGMSRRLRWTDADVVHFAGYALWSYMTTPFHLEHSGVSVQELQGRRLLVTYPPDLPAHCRRQTFHVRADGLVGRLDYTAEVFGPWARGAHRCLEYETVGGIVFATRRRVTPRGLPAGVPAMMAVEIDEIELVVGAD